LNTRWSRSGWDRSTIDRVLRAMVLFDSFILLLSLIFFCQFIQFNAVDCFFPDFRSWVVFRFSRYPFCFLIFFYSFFLMLIWRCHILEYSRHSSFLPSKDLRRWIRAPQSLGLVQESWLCTSMHWIRLGLYLLLLLLTCLLIYLLTYSLFFILIVLINMFSEFVHLFAKTLGCGE
jgi:hypothetical protein